MPVGGRLTISTEDRPAGGSDDLVLLAVSDTGIGMDEAVPARLFEPFFTTKEPGRGTGLGLATCLDVVQHSGARLEVSTEPANGSTFAAYFPRAAEDATPVAASTGSGDPEPGSGTILAVEDEPLILRLLVRSLSRLGYRVTGAPSGERALEALANADQLDLVVTDVALTGMDGRKLAARVRERFPSCGVLFVSGHGQAAGSDAGIEPPYAFLPKPFTLTELASALREVLPASS